MKNNVKLLPKKEAASSQRRGIYILPNFLTTAALFFGFYAIVQAMNGYFISSALAIFTAMVFDFLDGRVARLTHTQSDFGKEYDSLSDMVSFGVAPAFLMYEWVLRGFGKLGWIVAFIYCVSAALRLARFNSHHEQSDPRYFQGLPSPAAAGLMAGWVWVTLDHLWLFSHHSLVTLGLTLFAGLTMVSNVCYYSGKELSIHRRVPFLMVSLVALIFAIVSLNPALIFFLVFLAYAISGYAFSIWHYFSARRNKKTIL